MGLKKQTGLMTKREFVASCAFGVGACVLGYGALGSRAKAALKLAVSGGSENLWRWSREALFCVQTPRGLKCLKCPNECVLDAGETGLCRNRINHEGKLYSNAYGNPCAVHIDPIEKKPFFHFLPSTRAFSIATAGCNLACLNCQNWQISQVSPKETDNYDMMPPRVVEQCLDTHCESIAYTYSEPTTFYEYALDTAKLAREKKIRNVLKSNGYVEEAPLRQLSRQLDAANIDLKSFDDDVYLKLTRGRLEPVLRTLKVLREEHVWLEITNLVIPGWTDDLKTIEQMCEWLSANGLRDCPLHFSRFTPLHKLNRLPLTPVSTLDKAREIALKSGIRYVYLGNIPGHEAENTYCHNCGKLIVERRGFGILSNHIVKGRCRFCKERIPGVWS